MRNRFLYFLDDVDGNDVVDDDDVDVWCIKGKTTCKVNKSIDDFYFLLAIDQKFS